VNEIVLIFVIVYAKMVNSVNDMFNFKLLKYIMFLIFMISRYWFCELLDIVQLSYNKLWFYNFLK